MILELFASLGGQRPPVLGSAMGVRAKRALLIRGLV